MAFGQQKRVKLPKKLHILDNNVTNYKDVKERCIVLDAILNICKLKLKLEDLKREYRHLLKNKQEVKVEKFEENFLVNITCKKGQNVLVSILETFEEMGLNVAQAKVSCTECFLSVEAIVGGRDQGEIDMRYIEQAVLNAIDKQVD